MDALDELMDRGTQPVAEPDTLDSAMDNYIGGQVGAVRAGATLAADSNPDEIARQKRIATSLGVPLSAVEADPAFATREQKMRQIEAATAQSPALRQKFTNEDFAKLAHDNVDNLSAIEQLWRSAKRGWTAGLRGLDAGAVDDSARILSAIDTIERDGALSPVDPLASMFSGVGSSPENLKQMRAKHQGRLAANAVEFTRRTTGLSKLQPTGATADFYAAKGWADSFSALLSDPFEISANIATESLGIMAPGMPLIAAGGVAGGARGLAGMVGATSTSAEYSSAIAEALQASGVDMNDIEAVKAAAASPEFADVRRKAAIKAVVVGAFDAATAGLAGVKLRPSMAGNLAAQTGVQSAGGAAGEAFGSIASGQEVNASSVLAEAIGEIPGAVFDVATMAGRHALNGQRKADEAEQGAAFIENVNKLAAADKLLQRSPDDFQSFVAAAAEDGPVDTVYIDGKTLMQSGMAPKLVEMSPAVRDQLDRAILTGGQIAIPVDEYAARIAPSELAPQLLDHLKTEPDGFSRTEAADWMANSGSEFQSEVERILTDRQDADTFRASQDVVKQDILGQLNTAGRFTPQVNEAYATLASAYSAVRAAQLGMTPEAFHQQRGMRVQGAAVAGQQFSQSDEVFDWSNPGGGSREVKAGDSTIIYGYDGKSAHIISLRTPSAKRDKGSARAAMEQFLREADARGIPVKLESSPLDKRTKDVRLFAFYKSLGFEPTGKKINPVGDPEMIREPKPADQFNQSGQLITDTPAFNRKTGLSTIETFDPADPNILNQSAYHGSPYKFDKFTLDHIGSGEGAQAYGFGLYFAGKREIAEFYREKLAEGQFHTARGEVFDPRENLKNPNVRAVLEKTDGDIDAAVARARQVLDSIPGTQGAEYAAADIPVLENLKAEGGISRPVGQLYEVNIPEDGEYLLFDKPLSEQPEKVREALLRAMPELRDQAAQEADDADALLAALGQETGEGAHGGLPTITGDQFYSALTKKMAKPEPAPSWTLVSVDTDEHAWSGQEAASKYLNSLGIAGIKYLDGASRNRPLREIKREFLAELPEDADFAEVSDLIGTGTFSPANEAVIKALQADDWLGFDYPAQALSAALGDKLAGFDASKALKDAVEAAQDGSTYNYVIFDENAVQILQTYYQPAGGTTTPRGSFSPATNTVTLLKNADLSTFLHESAHYFFESDIQLASELLGKESLTSGEQEIVDDVSSLLTWHGIQGDVTEQLRRWHTMDFEEQRSHHERTAESFEAYLFSGKAPSLELQPLFQRFAMWMEKVYDSLKAFLARHPEAGKLNPEVRQVFDRMIATREEIALAEQARSMIPLFNDPKKSGVSAEEYAKIQAQHVDATNTAVDELRAKGLRDLQWLKNAKGKQVARLKRESKALRSEVEIEARREVMSQPVYQAWEFLTGKADGRTEAQLAYDEARAAWNADRADHEQKTRENLKAALLAANPEVKGLKKGQLLAKNKRQMNIDTDQALLEWDAQHPKPEAPPALSEGETAGGNPFGRLDLAGLASIGAPDEVVNVLKARKMTAKEGMHPDLVATMFEGFSSGDELVRKLAAAQPPKEAITALADRLMLENHGELSTPEAIELAADAAIHNDARARFVATEYNALAQATGQRKILTAAAKEYAAAMIARLKVRDIRPSQYANAEVRAAKASAKASQSGDLATAAAEKRNQVINTYATRAAYDAQDEVKAGLDYIRRRVTSATSQKNMRGEARAQLLALLDRFDLRKSVSLKELDRQQSLVDWAASEADRLAAPPPILSPEAADEGKRTHYKNLTVEEFRGLMDSVKQLEHLARREQKAYIAIRNMTLQEEVANAVAEIREAWPAAFDADGKAKIATPLTHRYAKTFGDKLTEGLRHLNAEFVPMEELVGQLTAGKFGLLSESLFGRISSASDRKSIMAGEIRDRLAPAYAAYTFQEKHDFSRKVVGDTGMTRENLLMLALYYGNVEGRQRLASQGFSDQVVLARLSNLTEKDLNLAEAIWSLNDGYIWPQYAALNERTQGKAPAKVQALPIQIGARTVKGGYVKLVYDSQFDEKTRHRDSMDDAMAMIGGRANQSAKTNQSSSNERIQELAKMPLLELRAMSQAVNEHMHDIAYREAIADTVRVLRETDMANAIKAVAGKEIYTELLAKVNEVAARPAEPTSMVLKGLNLARKNTVVVLMSGIRTALINYSGLVPALFDNRINAGALVKNIAKVHSPRMREMLAFAMEKSIYMRERNQQFTSDLQHEMASLTVKNRLIPEMGTFLILMRMVDQITSTSVWLAAYEEGKKAFPNDDARAVEYADSVVRSTQAGGRDVDTSKIMTRFGAWSKPFLMFYSFFSRQLGLLVRNGVISRQTWERGNKAKSVGQFTAAYIGIVVIPALINDMASGRCDDAFETGDGWGKCISKAIAMNMAGFVPVVRDLAPYAWGMLDDSEPNFGLRSTALTAYFEGIIKGAASTVDVVNDEGDERDTKSIFMGLAFLFGLPGKLLWDTMAGTEAVINEDAPPQSMLFGPPKN